MCLGFRALGFFRTKGGLPRLQACSGSRVSGFRGFGVQGLGFLGFRVQGSAVIPG